MKRVVEGSLWGGQKLSCAVLAVCVHLYVYVCKCVYMCVHTLTICTSSGINVAFETACWVGETRSFVAATASPMTRGWIRGCLGVG